MLYVTLITLLVLAIGTGVLLRATKQVVDGYEDAEGFHALVPTAVQPSHGANAEQPGVTRIVGPASLV